MTVKKVKTIFDTRNLESRYVLHSFNEHNRARRKSNSYLSIAVKAFFLAFIFAIVSYYLLEHGDDLFDVKPTVNIILTPQDLQSIK